MEIFNNRFYVGPELGRRSRTTAAEGYTVLAWGASTNRQCLRKEPVYDRTNIILCTFEDFAVWWQSVIDCIVMPSVKNGRE